MMLTISKVKINFMALVVLTSATTMSFATNKNAGTSGAPFLKMGAGARTTAMGDSFVGLADDVNAAYFNPAGLGFLRTPEITALHSQWIQGLDYDYGAFVNPTSFGAIAIQAATLKVADQQRRNSSEAEDGSFDTLDAAYGLSYSNLISNSFAIGLTGRFVRQQIDSTTAKAWAGDIGILHQPLDRSFRWGLAVRHIGQSIKFNEEADPLPRIYDLGASDSFFGENLKVSADVRMPRDNNVQFGVGTEYKINLRRDFKAAFRFGFNSANTDSDGAKGLSFGAGVGFKKFDFDFAWVPFGDLGNTFRYAATLKF